MLMRFQTYHKFTIVPSISLPLLELCLARLELKEYGGGAGASELIKKHHLPISHSVLLGIGL